jgi:hypothetical protein
MFDFKEKNNPVGVAHKIEAIEIKISQYTKIWDQLLENKSFWKPKVDLSKVTNFLLFALDDFIVLVNEVAIPGPDKKATVLDAIDRLYEYTVREAMPIWMRPFAAPIKNYIVYVLVSSAIDWIVAKYQSAGWRADRKSHSWDSKFVPCRFKRGKA